MRAGSTSEAVDSIVNDFANVELVIEKGGDKTGVDGLVLLQVPESAFDPYEPVPTGWQRHLILRWVRATFGLTIFVLAGCMSQLWQPDQSPRETKLAVVRVELPAIFKIGRPYVDLRVNGKGPYRFLVDTGAEVTCITRQVAREAGVSASRHNWVKATGSSGDSEFQPMGIVDRIDSPGASFEGVVAAILRPESADLVAPREDKSNGGIIGTGILRNVRLEIDYPAQKISLIRLDGEALPAGRGIPYTGSRPHVTIATPSSRDFTPTTALIDTGAESGFVLSDIASYPVRVGLAKEDRYSNGIGGHVRPLFGQLAGDIRLGTATWRDPEIHSGNENRIGSDALAPWKLVIDQRRKMLWLLEENRTSVTTWTWPLEADGRPLVLGYVVVPGGDTFVVKEVDPGSRAERAGLKVGDRILPQSVDAGAPEQTPDKNPPFARMRILRGDEKLEIAISRSEPLPASAKPPL